MKKIIFLLLTMAGFAGNNFGQSGFELEITEYPYYFELANIINLSDSNYLVAYNKDSAFSKVFGIPVLTKFNSAGDIINSVILSELRSSFINNLFKLNDSTFIGEGFIHNGDTTFNRFNLWVFQLDADLDFIWQKEYHLIPEYPSRFSGFRNSIISNNNIVLAGFNMEMTTGQSYLYLVKLALNGDTLVTKRIFSEAEGYDIITNKDNSGYLVAVASGILSTDTLFNEITTTEINAYPDFFLGYTNIEPFNNKIIFSGLLAGDDNGDIGIKVLDTNFNTLFTNKFGKQDTIDYPYDINLDYFFENEIFVCGSSNLKFADNPFLPITPSWYIINKVDSNLNLLWQKFYGGDMSYTFKRVVATSDGGCILGKKFSYPEQYNTNTLHVLKLNSDGLLIGVQKPGIQVVDVLVYPNPGTEMITVRNGIPGRMLDMELYNNEGKIVLIHKNIGLYEEIIVPHIPAGVYHYQLRNKGNLIDSGSWIKQ